SLRTYAESFRPREAAPTGDLNDDQLQAALDEGRMTQMQVINYKVERSSKKLVAEHVDPLRKMGTGAISDVTRRTVENARGADDKLLYPHAKRYGKEIKEQLDAAA